MITETEKIKFFTKCFGENYKLSKNGENIAVKCPACSKGTSKLKLSICLNTLRCHCWVCGIKGKNPLFIIKKHVSNSLGEEFREKFNISDSGTQFKEDELRKEVVAFPSEFILLAENLHSRDPDIRDCIRYLKRRGITEKLMWFYKIGTLMGRRWSRSVFFPSFDENHKLSFYVSRSIDKDAFIKYKNHNSEKSEIIFDEFRLDFTKEITITEGVFDMVKCGENATTILGSSLPQNGKLFKKIISNKTPVLLALDADMRAKSLNIAKQLSEYDIQVRILELGDYKDVGEMPSEIVRQKAKLAPIYSCDRRLQYLIGTICSGSTF